LATQHNKARPHGTHAEMDISGRNPSEDEIERLRQALDAETERRLQVQKRLERATAEFEEFVSMAAHHLRESLRDVAANSQLMAETYASRLDSDGDVFLSHIRDGVARMQSLLTDMVEYAVAGTGDRLPSRTDMEAVLLLAMDEQLRESAIVSHDPLPVVMGNSEMLTKVLKHLIRNAVEYCGIAYPRVHISSKRERLEWVFAVQDNGPGIDPAFHDRVFGVFKRLHGKEYAGTGLGLAFCKKAIEWHGGRIWVESTPGKGSTFYFTLPPADPDFSE
jgi:light-regulated signal transduction histidine kinase (bacteriophytochrome)